MSATVRLRKGRSLLLFNLFGIAATGIYLLSGIPSETIPKQDKKQEETSQSWKVAQGVLSDNHKADLNKTHPDVIVIGVPGCGNNVLVNFLNRTGFIQSTNNFGSDAFRGKGRRLIVEHRPDYFYAPPSISNPARILELHPTTKVVLLLCDPAQRAYSCFVHNKEPSENWPMLFEVYARKNLEQLQYDLNKQPDFHQQQKYLLEKFYARDQCWTGGLYVYHVERWTSTFNPEQLAILDGEEMAKDPRHTFARLLKFLGIPEAMHEVEWVKDDLSGQYCLRHKADNDLYCQKALTRFAGASQPTALVANAMRTFYTPYNQELYKTLRQDFGW